MGYEGIIGWLVRDESKEYTTVPPNTAEEWESLTWIPY